MIYKLFALVLVYIPFTFGHMQLHVQLELKDSVRFTNRTVQRDFTIDTNESGDVYHSDGLRLVVNSLQMHKEHATMCVYLYDAREDTSSKEILSGEIIVPYESNRKGYLGLLTHEGDDFTLQFNNKNTHFLK